MEKREYEQLREQLSNGPDQGSYGGLSLEVLRQMPLQKALELGEYVEGLDEDDDGDRDLLLCHLAAMVPGCEERFKEYLGVDGEEELFPRECVRLVPSDAPAARPIVGTAHEGTCGFCGLQLLTLLDLDLSDERLRFLDLPGTRLRIPMCIRCTCFTRIFAEVDFDGAAVWSRHNQRPDFIGRDGGYPGPSSVVFVLGPARRTFEAHGQIRWNDTSQIGGYPTWIQEPRYPKCPGCQELMPYIGQAENGAAWRHEGMTYGFLCRSCRISATGYQQT
jgi:hypothetical protein